jgi:RNA polymerase sigma-70 factor (TIGR02960 family)
MWRYHRPVPGPQTSSSQADPAALLAAARGGDQRAFEHLVATYRVELLAHCYRLLGAVHDAEDALQEALLGAWRGLAGFAGRSSVRTWLYTICTNACLRQIARRPKRILTPDFGRAFQQTADLGEPVTAPIWLEPWPDDPADTYVRRESVELAFVAALQHLPATQRAVLILREVLEFSAAEVAAMLDTTPAAVNSALQRARKAVEERVPERSQQAELAALGTDGQRALVDAFVSAWERADVAALLDLLTEDVTFTMPPLPAWFDGRSSVRRFFTERVFETPWRLAPVRANAQLAVVCYQGGPAGFRLGAVNVLTVREGLVAALHGFLDPAVTEKFRTDR